MGSSLTINQTSKIKKGGRDRGRKRCRESGGRERGRVCDEERHTTSKTHILSVLFMYCFLWSLFNILF